MSHCRGQMECGCSDESPYPCFDCAMAMAAKRAERESPSAVPDSEGAQE